MFYLLLKKNIVLDHILKPHFFQQIWQFLIWKIHHEVKHSLISKWETTKKKNQDLDISIQVWIISASHNQ